MNLADLLVLSFILVHKANNTVVSFLLEKSVPLEFSNNGKAGFKAVSPSDILILPNYTYYRCTKNVLRDYVSTISVLIRF